ncbi:MAG TPA: nuclear transport factor 2 family protein [Armatimonadaceae bacterium]|nr:nuclear transport factor 2 family protein [Armatimonadaceae bacterium]
MSETSERNKATLEAANEAVARGDNEGFLAFCTDDTRWEFVGERTLEGKEAVRRWMETAYAEPPRFSVAHLIAEGDFVVAIGRIATKDEGGATADSPYCDVWQFRDGKMAGLRAFVIRTGSEGEEDNAARPSRLPAQ